jgi:hypothetical protein
MTGRNFIDVFVDTNQTFSIYYEIHHVRHIHMPQKIRDQQVTPVARYITTLDRYTSVCLNGMK